VTAPDDVLEQIQTLLDANSDPQRLKYEVLRRIPDRGLIAVDPHKPGPTPDNSAEACWQRLVAADPAMVLNLMRSTKASASAKVMGNGSHYELVLPQGAGRLTIQWHPK
jgi:hypothetical protein